MAMAKKNLRKEINEISRISKNIPSLMETIHFSPEREREMYAEDLDCTEDLVREILWREERVMGLNKTETQIEFLKDILEEMACNIENRPFEGIYANIG